MISSDHTVRLETNKKTEKSTNPWRLINMRLNSQWITEEVKKSNKINKNTWRQMKMKRSKNLWDAAKAALRQKL